MVTRSCFYLFELLVLVGLMWLGFEHAGQPLPSPLAAPWLWLLVLVAPLIPLRHAGWEGTPMFWCNDLED